MPFHINVFERKEPKFHNIELTDTLTVGRNPDNQVVLPHDSVSRYHAAFHLESSGGMRKLILRDKGSTNGCIVNGKTVSADSVKIHPGDTIGIGIYRVEIVEEQEVTGAQPRDSGNAKIICKMKPSFEARLRESGIEAFSGSALLESMAATISESLPFEALYMALETEPGFPVVLTKDENGSCPPDSISVNKPLVGNAMKEAEALLAETQDEPTHKTILCVPLLDGKRNCGVIYVRSAAGVVYTEEHLKLLVFIASQLSHNSQAAAALQETQSEKRTLETILGSLPEAVVLADDKFKILACNAAACAVVRDEEIIGKRLDEVLLDFDPSFNPHHLESLTPFRIDERRALDGDDDNTPMIYLGSWGRNPSSGRGEWKYVLCLHDVTREKRLEHTKLRFVERLARRIITPLTAVTATNSLVTEHLSQIEDPQLAEMLKESLDHSELCVKLIRRFVDFTSLSCSTGSSGSSWKGYPLESLIAEATEEVQALIAEKEFEIVSLFQPNTVSVEGNKDKLDLIFSQLVHNAVKFGKRGGKLLVGAKAEEGRVLVSFLDDGPGISLSEDHDLSKILFEVDPFHPDDFPEMGIGLWLVNEAVHYHEGKLQISSPANEDQTGTLIQVTLPSRSREEQNLNRESASPLTATRGS